MTERRPCEAYALHHVTPAACRFASPNLYLTSSRVAGALRRCSRQTGVPSPQPLLFFRSVWSRLCFHAMPTFMHHRITNKTQSDRDELLVWRNLIDLNWCIEAQWHSHYMLHYTGIQPDSRMCSIYMYIFKASVVLTVCTKVAACLWLFPQLPTVRSFWACWRSCCLSFTSQRRPTNSTRSSSTPPVHIWAACAWVVYVHEDLFIYLTII